MSCRLHWKAYGHDCPQVGMAGHMHSQRNSCSLGTGQQVGAQSWEVTGCVLLLWESRGWWHWVSIFPHCMSFPLVRRDSVGGAASCPACQASKGSHALQTGTCGRRTCNPRPGTIPRAPKEVEEGKGSPFGLNGEGYDDLVMTSRQACPSGPLGSWGGSREMP